METAIRNALSRVENPDETQRARIYQTARDALLRNLESRGITEPDQVRSQIGRLKDLIVRIEADYDGQAPMASPAPQPAPDSSTAPEAPPRPRASRPPEGAPDIRADREPAPAPADPASGATLGFSPAAERAQASAPTPEIGDIRVTHAGSPVSPPGPTHRLEPQIDAPRRDGPADVPNLAGERRPATPAAAPGASPEGSDFAFRAPAADDGLTLPPRREPAETVKKRGLFARRERKAEPKTKRRRERHVFASTFSSLVLLSFLGIGVWWLYDSGAFDPDWDTSVPNPPPNVSSEDFSGNGSAPRPLNPESGFSRAWTTIYAPRTGDTLSAGSLASASIQPTENGPVLTITSADGGEDGEVTLPIDASSLQALAGGPSVISLTVRATGDQTTPFYVKCDFGSLGDCGRRRFNAESQATDALIEVDFTRQLAPTENGTISINSDVSGQGRSIELFAVRVHPAN